MKCNICGADAFFLFDSEDRHGRCLLSKDTFKIYKCKECKVVFTDVDANSDYYNKYYSKDYYRDSNYGFFINGVIFSLQRISFLQKLRLIKRYKPRENNILEIGCGKGDFLSKLPSYFKKYGVEINKCACQHVSEHYKDITIYNKKLGDEVFNGGGKRYDAIVMWHVFEHIDNPEDFLKDITGLLAKDGVIILEIPNRNSIGFKVAKKFWFHLDTPRHLFHYNYQSLNRLLEKYSFKIVGYRANPVDYCQDLISSLYMKFKANNCFLNSIMLVVIVPFAFIIRLIAALSIPAVSEINTYIIKHI